MKIEVGKHYKTRNGQKAYVASRLTLSLPWPLQGFVFVPTPSAKHVRACDWTDDGFTNGLHDPFIDDLVAEWEKPAADPLIETAKIFDELPEAPQAEKFCVDCKWCVTFNYTFSNGVKRQYVCSNPKTSSTSVVTGQRSSMDCENARGDGYCTVAGYFWEKR